ncbi:DUF4190 domain-containing protein [Rathayibacter toxicus]|uniref:DUF4190 domain-containing protein n=1 Tax=Rathayibacter toxicus TaxID=145458 RepID=A0A0C5BCY8_9MICO|nr:DUF4190 domain-containing protein [Rathayibacter toxicus]AJM76874.1 hypothetical protein TI83_00580 [Rathayibacter toxicus]ALS57358.1 hypothetical protein APU90_05900 [Rathayibacter toxicus]KKM45675.1 hypothetical protein VT73_05805 [Rathayibacter toxicus]PPG24764.1 DUF4190 domain-containing protein [Rathayibacter toxicus]PPG48218.1 DUF4190 domain-containing protein [Rathayibacter toxicus]
MTFSQPPSPPPYEPQNSSYQSPFTSSVGQPPVFPPPSSFGPPPSAPPRSPLAITALVLGIVAVVLSFLGFLALPVVITALVVGIIAMVKKALPRGFSLAGLILGGVSFVLSLIFTVLLVIGANNLVSQEQLKSSQSSPNPSSKNPQTASLGSGVKFDDGLAVGVSTPTPFTPDKYATGVNQAKQIVVTIVVKNDTSAPWDPLADVTASSGGAEASNIIGGAGLQPPPLTSLLPGQQVKWQKAFSIADEQSLVVQVHLDSHHGNVVFTHQN